MRLHHVGLVCSSRDKADRFYEGILGLEKIKASELTEDLMAQIFHIPQRCLMISYTGQGLAVEVFVPEELSGEKAPFAHICLEVEDREQFIRKCHDSGLEVRRIPKGDTWLAFVADYDGNLFEIKQRPL
jgi:catechol 2,3-dioxygenase-like lactoylglutathione lyase family enzyme